MNSIRIAYIIPSLRRTGPIVMLRNLCAALLKSYNTEVKVFYFDNIVEIEFPCQCEQINFSTPMAFDDYDIIHAHCFRADRYMNKWRSKIKNAKTVSTLHQDTYECFRHDSHYNKFLSILLTKYWCYLQGKCNGVIAISEMLNNKYRRLLKCPVYTIYNGIQTDILSANVELNQDYLNQIHNFKKRFDTILCSYALIRKVKGLDQVIKILKELPYCGFVLIGDGPEKKELIKLSNEIGVNNQILFLPYVEYPFLYLDDCDIYVMTSYSEGFGLSMVEAAYNKKAIVCSDLPSFHEIFQPGDAVFFTLDNIESLRSAVLYACENKSILSINAYKRVRDNFTQKILAENHFSLYQQMLNVNSEY